MNPLYKDIRGKVITDFYSEYDLQMLGFSLDDFTIDPNADDYQKASDLSDAALDIDDKDLQEAAEALLREMQIKEGFGRE